MSKPKHISPLLDGFLLGEAISSHHGVRCCPAIRENTDERYIIKIISIPATQSQLDALLLTGACTDKDQALTYFKELSEGVIAEANLLEALGKPEGFAPYEAHQLCQMEEGVGYQVYLLSPYKRSLDSLMRSEPLTHLAAINLGLDLCAALTAARRAGYLYVDLKPENIFLSDTQGYQIGDLGFLPLASVQYASLPEKYRSGYTAPEIGDAMSTLNATLDIYALGLILYQLYNNGQLPDRSGGDKEYPTPEYADYELAQIILKACSPDPAARWQDPAQMGQALVDYMQRNGVNDTPIIPAPIMIEDPEEPEEPFLTEEENDREFAALLAMIPDEVPPQQLTIDGADIPEEVICEAAPEQNETTADTEADNDGTDQLSFLDENGITNEVARMLAQADDLIAHELPEPVVAPGPIDVPVPPLVIEEENEEPEEAPVAPLMPETTEAAEEADEEDTYDDEEESLFAPPVKRGHRRWVAAISIVLLLIAAMIGATVWYQEFFLQNVDALDIYGTSAELRVSILSDIDEMLLSVVCTDTYGNTMRSPVVGGYAVFTDLNPATQYRIRVEISGLHKLTGQTTGSYTTGEQTKILNFSAVCGPENGSVILNFSVSGPDCDQWGVVYTAPGEKAQTQYFTGHTVTIFGLSEGKSYTFRLTGSEDSRISGDYEITYTAQGLLTAEDLKVIEWNSGNLTLQWQADNAPAGQKWLLRCYNDAGFDVSVTTEDTAYTFTELDQTTGYTVLVTADGMTSSRSTSVTANPINVTGYTAAVTNPWELSLNWEFTGAAPANGWLLRMTVDGGEQITLTCPENSATIALIPGCVYTFTAEPADDITFFTESYSFTAEDAILFEGYGITAANLKASMVLRPEKQNWGSTDLTDESYKTEFTSGELASVLLRVGKNFTLSKDKITVTFAIRNDNAQLVSAESKTASWNSLWNGVYCPLDLPAMPTEPGSYTLDLYFGEQYVTSLAFTVV